MISALYVENAKIVDANIFTCLRCMAKQHCKDNKLNNNMI